MYLPGGFAHPLVFKKKERKGKKEKKQNTEGI